jgi:hypothetical protein
MLLVERGADIPMFQCEQQSIHLNAYVSTNAATAIWSGAQPSSVQA